MRIDSRFLIVFLFFIGTSCANRNALVQNPQPASDPSTVVAAADESNLTQTEAEARARDVSDVRYDLKIEVGDEERFIGTIDVRFKLREVPAQLFLDFKADGEVSKLSVNGVSTKLIEYKSGRIFLSPPLLKKGENVVQVRFAQSYTSDGNGLYRFKDPEDGRTYLWTQFEAYYANYVFPCFDQPDLKAKMKMVVTAPSSWQVITTTRETAVEVRGSKKLWTFPETLPLSTYLFSLHAGPYHQWSATAGEVPLRLFVRRSLHRYVDPEEWFSITRAGLKFFGDYFARPYPFGKYDQVIVPDFNAGAMENVGAVTFSEEYVSRGKKTREEREAQANVILHEMAHMWFGNLVTMEWWNGLWLNESFASYMATYALAEATDYKDAWVTFQDEMKAWAYWEDQLVTTHPIEGPVSDTRSAFTAFDGITYGKGAAVLKQLHFFLGEENFREGLRRYFQKHAFGNTRLEDFMGSLSTNSQSLSDWSNHWLLTTGVDTVSTSFTCESGKIRTFDLTLTATVGEIRPHRVEIGLYQEKDGKLELTGSHPVDLRAKKTSVDALVGRNCPDLVFPNQGDYAYLKVKLDAKSLGVARERLKDVRDRFARLLLWSTLYQMVRDGELKPEDYLRIVAANFEAETDLKVFLSVSRTLIPYQNTPPVFYYLPTVTESQRQLKKSWQDRFEVLFWKRMENSSDDLQKASLDGFMKSAQSPNGQKLLLTLLEKNARKGIRSRSLFPALDQDRRWDAVVQLNSLNAPGADAALSREKVRDSSERGVQQAMAAEAARPNLETKVSWIERIENDSELSLARKEAVLKRILPWWQESLRESLSDRYFAALTRFASKTEQESAERYAQFLLPAACTPASSDRISEFLIANQGRLSPAVSRAVRIGLQENDRCVQIRAGLPVRARKR